MKGGYFVYGSGGQRDSMEGVVQNRQKVVWVIKKMLFLVRGDTKNANFGRGVLKIQIPLPFLF